MMCVMIGTVYLFLGQTWKDVYSFASMLFFIVAFLTFMAIAGAPAFAEDMQVRTVEASWVERSTFVFLPR